MADRELGARHDAAQHISAGITDGLRLRAERPEAMRALGETPGADRIMNESIFVGVYPGLSRVMLDYMIERICAFCRRSRGVVAR